MKHLGIKGGWKKLATACLCHAVKDGDFICIQQPVFSLLCDMAEQEENEVIVEIRHSADMIKLYGKSWYKRSKK